MYKKSSLKTQDKSKGMKVREDCVMKEVATRANEACSCWKPWTLVESTHLGVLYSWGQGPKLFIQQIPLSISPWQFLEGIYTWQYIQKTLYLYYEHMYANRNTLTHIYMYILITYNYTKYVL